VNCACWRFILINTQRTWEEVAVEGMHTSRLWRCAFLLHSCASKLPLAVAKRIIEFQLPLLNSSCSISISLRHSIGFQGDFTCKALSPRLTSDGPTNLVALKYCFWDWVKQSAG
jgi:hypothetical protein